jgi:dihydroorotase
MSRQERNILTIEGNFVNYGDLIRHGCIHIDKRSGLIEKIDNSAGGIVTDGLIFPGFIDIHVHAREDTTRKNNYKEDFDSAAKAAIHGGVVCIVDMPNNPEPPVDRVGYLSKASLACRSLVDIVLYAGVGKGTLPLGEHVPYKVFMGAVSSKSPSPYVSLLDFHNFSEIRAALSHYEHAYVSFHCEDSKVLAASACAATHEERRPPEAEVKAIAAALGLIKKFSLQGNICHVSTKKGLDKIVAAKKKGLPVTCEVTPHHLFFDTDVLDYDNRNFLAMNPPLRSSDDSLALIEGLRRGDIDYLASDHAPHTLEEKARGISGVPNLDTYGPFTTWLMSEHGFTAQDIARVCAYNPARFVNRFLTGKYGFGLGRIEEGYLGSLTVLAPESPVMIEQKDLITKCGWSPFSGVLFPGSVLFTVVRGEFYPNWLKL